LLFLSGIIERFFKKSIACNHFSDSMQSFFEKRRYDRAKKCQTRSFSLPAELLFIAEKRKQLVEKETVNRKENSQ